MKIRLLSDLHLEGFHFKYQHCGEEVLVLAGDINTRNRHRHLLDEVPDHVQVLFVAGNHEYYHGVYEKVNEFLLGLEQHYKNFKFLNNTAFTIGDIEVFGGTMFTDFLLHGEANKPLAKLAALRGVNDFRLAECDDRQGGLRPWTVDDHEAEHNKFCREIALWLKHTEGKKRLVVTHFNPHPDAIHPRFKNDTTLLNAYFTADMERFMGWPGHWLFGHTHDNCDVTVGDTRVIANPKGYGAENWKCFNPNFMIEI